MNFVFIGLIFLSVGLVYGDTDAEWRQAALEKHNEYRQLHGAQPLTMNTELCEMSQKWAEHLSTRNGGNKLVHSKVEGFGENLHWSMRTGSSSGDAKVKPQAAVTDWYNEIKDYDFATGDSPTGGVIGHFTQVVWKGSKEVCVSYVKKTGDNSVEFFVVANYRPPGNYIGEYIPNVGRASSGGGSGGGGGYGGGNGGGNGGGSSGDVRAGSGGGDDSIGSESRNSQNTGRNESKSNQGSRKDSKKLHSFWGILLGFALSFSVYP